MLGERSVEKDLDATPQERLKSMTYTARQCALALAWRGASADSAGQLAKVVWGGGGSASDKATSEGLKALFHVRGASANSEMHSAQLGIIAYANAPSRKPGVLWAARLATRVLVLATSCRIGSALASASPSPLSVPAVSPNSPRFSYVYKQVGRCQINEPVRALNLYYER